MFYNIFYSLINSNFFYLKIFFLFNEICIKRRGKKLKKMLYFIVNIIFFLKKKKRKNF